MIALVKEDLNFWIYNMSWDNDRPTVFVILHVKFLFQLIILVSRNLGAGMELEGVEQRVSPISITLKL